MDLTDLKKNLNANDWQSKIDEILPPEENVIERNRAITTCYARMYQDEPLLYKWAGMAAFASYHIGEQMKRINWQKNKPKTLAKICQQQKHSLNDDFQLIRIINNTIFADIGWVHLAFCQMTYSDFQKLLSQSNEYQYLSCAFDKLNSGRVCLNEKGVSKDCNQLIWAANCDILWNEQSKIVQPLFDEISGIFSFGMTLFASFHYRLEPFQVNWKTHSGFMTFMLLNAFNKLIKTGFVPDVTNLDQRWYWISNQLLKIWKKVDAQDNSLDEKINILAN